MAEPVTQMGPRNHVLDGVQISKGKGQFFEVVRPIEKHFESLLRCTRKKN